MGDDQRRHAGLAQQRQCLLADLRAAADVEPGEWLVEQQHPRFRCKCPQQRAALGLSAGKRMRVVFGERRKAHPLQRRSHAAPTAGIARQAEGDVPRDRQVGEQCIVLEHQADAAPFRRQR